MDDTDYPLGRSHSEYNRLIEQAELSRPLTERMLLEAGIKSGMHVLDVGCGVGDVSFLVSAFVGPKGSVVGVDLDGAAIKFAEERRAAAGVNNVEFRQSDARSVELNRLFDAAVGRLVLIYMNDSTDALRQIARRVRPDGILAFHEPSNVMTAAAMNLPVLAHLHRLLMRAFERSGARPHIGAELYWRMLEAGLKPDPRPLAEIVVQMGNGEVAYRRWALFARSLLPKIVEYGFASEKEVVDILDQLRAELVPVRGLIPLSTIMIGQWARKPSNAPGSVRDEK